MLWILLALIAPLALFNIAWVYWPDSLTPLQDWASRQVDTSLAVLESAGTGLGLVVPSTAMAAIETQHLASPPSLSPTPPQTETLPLQTQNIASLPTSTPVQTQTLTPLPTTTNTPTPRPTRTRKPTAQPTETGPKHILVSISEQRLYAYQGKSLIYEFVVSTGANNGTLTGSFSILDKIPKAWSDVGSFWMPDWMGIYWFGTELENGIHSLPVLTDGSEIWGDRLGSPMSYGCVVLSPQDSQTLFDWADIGTPVEITQ